MSKAATTSGGTSSPAAGITVVATAYKFAVTGTATGGFVPVRFENDAKEPHILVPFKLKPGKTAADALALLSAQQPDPEQVAATFDGDPNTSFYGTPGLLAPGDSETTVAQFSPGSYVLACCIPSPDGTPHFALGMLADLTVGDGNPPAPATQGTFEITGRDDHRAARRAVGHLRGGERLAARRPTSTSPGQRTPRCQMSTPP